MVVPTIRGVGMSDVGFEVRYTGDAVRNGTMAVRDLAPAILALGNLVEDANRVLNEGRGRVSVRVSVGETPGSFPVDLLVDWGLAEQIEFFARQTQVWSASDIIEFVGVTTGSTVSLIELMRHLRGEEPDKVEKDGSEFNFYLDGDVVFSAPPQVHKMWEDAGVRGNLSEAVHPLNKQGYNSMEFRREGKTKNKIDRQEVPYFQPKEGGDTLNENIQKLRLMVKQPEFDKGNKFRLSDGDKTFYASINDDEFWDEIESRDVGFYKGARMDARLKTRQIEKPDGGIRNEYEVLEVLDFSNPPRQGDITDAL